MKENLEVLAEPPFEFSEFTTSELEAAELYWLRYLQNISFSNEILYLQKEKSVPKTSKISQLCPFLDDNGLMRLKGRLQLLDVPLNQKHPIILPKSYLVKLIIDDYHQRTCHGGTNVVLCKLREQFWILKGRPFIKARIKTCIICQKLFAKPVSQPFGPLPIERITMSRPFECVGVDFAGPLFYLDESSNQMNKSYLMVFTCAAIRSVHLEVVTNMTTESCIMGLRRFIGRRGAPTTIYSDNAKTFRRAALELTNTNQVPDDNLVQNFLIHRRIHWKFIGERAPWWGGFWERLIRSIKNILKVVIGKAKLTLEQLRTVIIEAEGMVNIRPLTYVSSDPLDISPLTPAHFIHGHGSLANSQNLVTSSDMQQLWAQRLKITNMLWSRWRTEYVQLLRSFHHSQGHSSNQLKSNDVVLVFDSAKPRIAWKLAVVEAAFIGRDGKVRACEIRYADGSKTRRPVQLLYLLELTSLPRAEDVENY
ncbi:uncharacterized protein LOC129945267 [Eupeodes corollae]|uniref:uncharacterized protein LOC129945267 n=1 Tax=Eupeodes corollae TaxID=290404 RepID=UPI002491AA11|nr:uncharacterized protein LOC129945267 [Eupeodes corollae]